MFCVNCGKTYEPSYKFCNHCGYPLPSNPGQSEGEGALDQSVLVAGASVDAADTPEIHDQSSTFLPAPTNPTAPPEGAPYATFVSQVLGSALFGSVVVFNVADGLVRNRWEGTISTVIATVAGALLARGARVAWRRVLAVEPETDAMLKGRHRHVLRNSAVIITLFLTSAAIVGAAIGQAVQSLDQGVV